MYILKLGPIIGNPTAMCIKMTICPKLASTSFPSPPSLYFFPFHSYGPVLCNTTGSMHNWYMGGPGTRAGDPERPHEARTGRPRAGTRAVSGL